MTLHSFIDNAHRRMAAAAHAVHATATHVAAQLQPRIARIAELGCRALREKPAYSAVALLMVGALLAASHLFVR